MIRGPVKTTCPACRVKSDDAYLEPLEGFRTKPGICLSCGHIFIPVENGIGLSLTKAELENMRAMDDEQGGNIQAMHESIVRNWWG